MTNVKLLEALEQLENFMQKRLLGRIRNLRLTVGDAGIILQGEVRTYYVKQLAQQLAMERTNLAIQANEIEVV